MSHYDHTEQCGKAFRNASDEPSFRVYIEEIQK